MGLIKILNRISKKKFNFNTYASDKEGLKNLNILSSKDTTKILNNELQLEQKTYFTTDGYSNLIRKKNADLIQKTTDKSVIKHLEVKKETDAIFKSVKELMNKLKGKIMIIAIGGSTTHIISIFNGNKMSEKTFSTKNEIDAIINSVIVSYNFGYIPFLAGAFSLIANLSIYKPSDKEILKAKVKWFKKEHESQVERNIKKKFVGGDQGVLVSNILNCLPKNKVIISGGRQ
jgi:uncharacterized protein YgiM (DUF1202 family)